MPPIAFEIALVSSFFVILFYFVTVLRNKSLIDAFVTVYSSSVGDVKLELSISAIFLRKAIYH